MSRNFMSRIFGVPTKTVNIKRRYYLAAHRRVINVLTGNSALSVCVQRDERDTARRAGPSVVAKTHQAASLLYANCKAQDAAYAWGEVTSLNLRSRCDRHFVGLTRHIVWS